jgi:hypothetical protein
VRFVAALIGLVVAGAATASLLIWWPHGNNAGAQGRPTAAQMARLTALAGRVARDSGDPEATGLVVATTEPKLFNFNHRSGGNSGKDIYLVVLTGHFRVPVGIPSRRRTGWATGEQMTLEYAAKDLSSMGWGIGRETPGLLKLGPTKRLELP